MCFLLKASKTKTLLTRAAKKILTQGGVPGTVTVSVAVLELE
jgi:hypothetical protein